MYLEIPAPSRKSPYTKPAPDHLELTTTINHRSCRRILVALSFSDSTGRGWELGKCRGMGCVRSRTFFFFFLERLHASKV